MHFPIRGGTRENRLSAPRESCTCRANAHTPAMTRAWKTPADQHRKIRRKAPESGCISGAKHPICSKPGHPRIQLLCAGNGAKLPPTGAMHLQTLRCSAPGKPRRELRAAVCQRHARRLWIYTANHRCHRTPSHDRQQPDTHCICVSFPAETAGTDTWQQHLTGGAPGPSAASG